MKAITFSSVRICPTRPVWTDGCTALEDLLVRRHDSASGMLISPLGQQHAREIASVLRRAFDERLPWLAGLHTPDEDVRFVRDHVLPSSQVHGVMNNKTLIGFIAFREGWIDQLYVVPEAQGRGVGTALLAMATAAWPTLSLWTFQRNTGARRFYERHGFVAVETTDGSANEEKEPDVRYHWRRPPSP
jgi:putative acetyltransferase